MIIKAIRADQNAFAKYGCAVHLTDYEEFADPIQGWRCWITEKFCMDQAARIGMDFTREGAPYTVENMKRDANTKKLFACGAGPAILVVADTKADAAQAGDVRAFLLEPGDFVVINEGIWNDACHGVSGATHYFFLSLENEESTEYVPIKGGTLVVDA